TINISARDELAFIFACENRHLTVVRQLYEWKPTIDISARDEETFKIACNNGHLEVVRQLLEWKPAIVLSRNWTPRSSQTTLYYQYRHILIPLGITLPIPDTLTNVSIPEGEKLECPICMDVIQNECLVTKCGHKYCGKCINQWLEENSSCPYCRAPI
ncbi:MAG: hypothetical protein FJ336_08590, partial [Sphingomonadales bacterium]|nr:hypothetical protein [Sphingomonadales bacterium]